MKDDDSAVIDNENSGDLNESLEGTKGEENSEMVFAENLDIKEEYSKESNNHPKIKNKKIKFQKIQPINHQPVVWTKL